MPSEADIAQQLAAMMEICARVADEASVYADERRRIHAILVYLSDDESAHAVAATVVRESGQQATLPSAAALVAHEEAVMADLDAAPASVLNACHEGVKEALALREGARRPGAIVVCDCNDPRACGVLTAIAIEREATVVPEPDKAAAILHPHADVARIARALGYVFADVPEPRVGRMRVFLFFGGRVSASDMEVESEEEVFRAQDHVNKAGEVAARRIFEAKERQISRAVGALVASGLLRQHIVVVFGSRSTTALAVYRELAVLPGLEGFPQELPEGVPIANVPYDSFMEILRRHGGDMRGIEAAALGVNQVRIATFTPEGIYIQRMASIGLARGGAA